MKSTTHLRVAIVAMPAAIVAMALGAHGCGESRKIEGAPPGATSDLAFEITALQLPGPGVDAPRVTFRATDRSGKAIDVLAELANAATQAHPHMTNPRFTLAQIEADGSTRSWYEATANPGAFTAPTETNPSRPPPAPATQPGSQQAPTPPGNRLTANGDGTYTFVFAPPTTPAERRDPTKTMLVGMWAERVSARPSGAQGSVKRWPAAATKTFLQGNAAGPPHEAVSDAACSTCHVVLRAHGTRESVQLCKTCHSGDPAAPYRDPESNENIDFRRMIHRIHNGRNLPSVESGAKFYIVGFRQNVFDFSEGEFPPLREATDCTACHRDGANADAWKTKASLVACTSCHDNVRFDGTVGTDCQLAHDDVAPCDHPLSPTVVNASSTCSSCHSPGASAPPIGPDVVHRNETLDLAKQWAYEIQQVTIGADRKPVVRFRVTKNGAANDIKADPAWTQGAASRLFVDIAWPVNEFTNEGSGYADATVKPPQFPAGTPGQGLPVQINALTTSTPVAGQTNVYEVTSPTAIPPQFSSARVVLEGHPAEGTGPTAIRVPVANAVQDVAVGGGAVPQRRAIVSAENCNACHQMISAHGANRNATPAVCVVCHTPRATDFIRRVQANLAEPPTAEAPIDFKVLIHQIHAADIRESPVTVFGFGGSPNEFPAAFPGQTGRCTVCHVGDSYNLPLAPEVLDTTLRVSDPTILDPAADPAEQRMGRTMAVCTSCHDNVRFDAAAQRPMCNTLVPVNSAECSHSGGPITADAACASCHGRGQAFDVARVHAISDKPQ